MASRVVVIALSCAVAGGLRVPASPRVCASGRAIAPRNFAARARPPRLQASGGPPPPEVIEAEANATPNRKFRLAGAAALGLLSAASALASVTELTGGGGDVTEALLLPFGGAPLTLFVDVVLLGSCAWLVQQELATRDANIQRIWEEVQRRRGPKPAPKEKRRKKAKAPKPAAMPPPPPPPPLNRGRRPPARPGRAGVLRVTLAR